MYNSAGGRIMTTAERSGRRFGPLQLIIVLAAVATAFIHIVLALQFPGGVDRVFLLNGLGYLALTALLFAPFGVLDRWRTMIRWLLIIYTLITVVAWVFVGVRSPVAFADKAIEIVLIVCLWLDGLRARANPV
jgi:cellulose synthase/poly-beta-1,6-N-acetylglucosamine synthase-like glycosyltransferase